MSKHVRTVSKNTLEPCTFCTRSDRVMKFSDLEPGDHIRFGEGNFYLNMFKRNVSLFSHHAIVTEIEPLNATSANLTIVSFESSATDGEILVRETKRSVSLVYASVFVIRYCQKTCQKSDIIKRARSLVHSGERYSMLWNNCEHLAHYCCTGIKRSNQIYDLMFHLKEMTKSGVQHLVEFVLKLAKFSLDDIADSAFSKNLIGQGKAVSVLTLIYLLYCVYQHLELYRDLKSGHICPACCKDRLKYMWLKFIVYCSTQVDSAFILSVIISTGVGGNVLIGVKALLFAASAILMWAFPTLRHSLMSPFKGKAYPIGALSELQRGDVISFKKFGKMHDAIVNKVNISSDTNKGSVTIIHYSSPKLFGRRVIVQDDVDFDLDKDVIKRQDYSGYTVHVPDKVVDRALQRLGETKYGFLSNRSCHLCHWAKVDTSECSVPLTPTVSEVLEFDRSLNPEESLSPFSAIFVDQRQNRPKASSKLEKSWARIREDVKPGQIVRLKINGKRHYGVTTAVAYADINPASLAMHIVYKGPNNLLTEEQVAVDLNKEDVWIFKYHPVYQFRPEEIVTRARRKVGIRKCGKFEASFKVSEEIGKKKSTIRIDTFKEIKPGDVIVFYYWSVKHAAVVSDVVPTDRKTRTVAYVTVIHYSSDGWLSQSAVTEETIFMDLNKGDVFLKNYDGFVTYSNEDVVKRARSTIGEQKFSIFGNTTWDLAHWAKVVQTPAIVTKAHAMKTNETKMKTKAHGKEYLLLPEVGETYGNFQRLPVRQLKDLKSGRIVEYQPFMVYCQGILIEASEEEGTMTIVHYKPYSYMPMEAITKETVHVDLKRDHVWMYVCDPTKAHKASRVVANAEKCLQEGTVRLRRGSWGFCVECVLKDEDAPVVEAPAKSLLH